MVPPCSDRISRVPPYSNGSFITSTGLSPTLAALPNAFEFHVLHGLVRVRSPLLTESRLMSFPTGTEMFQFPAFALEDLCVQSTSTRSPSPSTTPKGRRRHGCQVGFPIRKFPDQRVLSPPRDLSQSATSFIASCRQGIHQTPLSRLIRPGRRPANPSAEGPGPSRTSLVHSFPSDHRTDLWSEPMVTVSILDLERSRS